MINATGLRDLAEEYLQIRAVTMTNALLGPVEEAGTGNGSDGSGGTLARTLGMCSLFPSEIGLLLALAHS